jgi:flagellar hook-length control protein FliK
LAAAQADDGKPQPSGDIAKEPHTADATPTSHHAPAEAVTLNVDKQTSTPKPAADAIPQTALSPAAQTSAETSATSASIPAPPAAAVPLAGLAVEIAGKTLAGKNRFEIRLDPPELGRIQVRLDVDRDGHVTSRLIVDRADTLDLLRRDAAGWSARCRMPD